jgi:plastocyanin
VQGPVKVEGDGNHKVEFRSTDAAGNVEDVKSVEFTIGEGGGDTTPPTTTHTLDPAQPGAGGTYNGPVIVNLSATDPASTGGGAPETHDVNAQPNSWNPNTVQATVGDTVRFNFPASAQLPHDVWLIKPGEAPDADGTPLVEGIKLPNDPPVSAQLTEAGTYTFVCKLHSVRSEGRWQGMVGTATAEPASSVPGSGVDYTEYRVTLNGTAGEWVRNTNANNADPFATTVALSTEGTYTVEYRSVDKAGNQEAVKSVGFSIETPDGEVSEDTEVHGTVPLAMGIEIGGPVSFGAFQPGVTQVYEAGTTLTATSSTPASALSAHDASSVATGHLVNGSAALPQPLQVGAGGPFAPLGGSSSPILLRSWTTPLAKEQVQVQFRQPIAETDRLLAGDYGKTVTFTLSATTP